MKGYLYDPIDCVKRAVAMEPGRVYKKDSSISILLVFSSFLVVFLYSIIVYSI
jgi:hypothetical protein